MYPGCYLRAGTRKTKEEWKVIFPNANIEWEREWFIDLSQKEPTFKKEKLDEIVDEIFESKGLHSLTYKEAAREVAVRFYNYKKQNT